MSDFSCIVTEYNANNNYFSIKRKCYEILFLFLHLTLTLF